MLYDLTVNIKLYIKRDSSPNNLNLLLIYSLSGMQDHELDIYNI